ncbi:MAG: hypothetical protein GXN98_03865, partial [Euryarchaeota archaeon]|nr:hypothetical protein [Euryarchaeota archaeon]
MAKVYRLQAPGTPGESTPNYISQVSTLISMFGEEEFRQALSAYEAE